MAGFSSKALEEIKTMREAGFTKNQIFEAIDSYLKQIDEESKKRKNTERLALEKELTAVLAKIYKFYNFEEDESAAHLAKDLLENFELIRKF